MDKQLADFLGAYEPLATEKVIWANGRFPLQVTAYLTEDIPPLSYLLSARSIVFRDGQVLLVGDPDGVHLLPGGRLERGETPWQAAWREVAEESGWIIEQIQPFGFLHYHHLNPPPDEPLRFYPDFLQNVYVSKATEYAPYLREIDGHELWAEFHPIEKATELISSPVQRAFLQNAIALGVQ